MLLNTKNTVSLNPTDRRKCTLHFELTNEQLLMLSAPRYASVMQLYHSTDADALQLVLPTSPLLHLIQILRFPHSNRRMPDQIPPNMRNLRERRAAQECIPQGDQEEAGDHAAACLEHQPQRYEEYRAHDIHQQWAGTVGI